MSVRTPRIIWIVLATGLLARLVVIHWAMDLELILDEVNYLDYGQHLLAHGLLPDAFRPPGYPSLVALAQFLGGEGPTSVRVLQSLVSVLAGWVLYRWLLPHTGHRGASLSAALWCLYPVFIGFSHLLWTETVFLSSLIFFLATALPSTPISNKRAFWAGVMYALASLTRSVLLPLAVIAPLTVMLRSNHWTWQRMPKTKGLLFLVGFGLTVLPWAIHNKVVEDRWIVVETTNGYNLWKGNTPWSHPFATEAPQYPGPWISIPMFPYEGSGPRLTEHCEAQHAGGDFRRWHLNRCARALAVEHIRADPAAFLTRGFSKLGHAFHPSNLLMRHLWLGLYGELPPTLRTSLIWGTTFSYLGALIIALVALFRRPRMPIQLFMILLAAYQLSVIFITFGNTRFRLPILLAGFVLAAWLPNPKKREIQTR